MKKTAYIVFLLCFLLLLVGCDRKNDDVLHLGLNATIVEIDASNHILYVADLGSSEVFGGRCAIDCKDLIEDEEIIYVLEGKGKVIVEGELKELEKGMVNVCKQHHAHSVINDSDKDLIILGIVTKGE